MLTTVVHDDSSVRLNNINLFFTASLIPC